MLKNALDDLTVEARAGRPRTQEKALDDLDQVAPIESQGLPFDLVREAHAIESSRR